MLHGARVAVVIPARDEAATIGVLAMLGAPGDARAQAKIVPTGDVPGAAEADIEGWNPFLALTGTISLTSNSNVVGQVDGEAVPRRPGDDRRVRDGPGEAGVGEGAAAVRRRGWSPGRARSASAFRAERAWTRRRSSAPLPGRLRISSAPAARTRSALPGLAVAMTWAPAALASCTA